MSGLKAAAGSFRAAFAGLFGGGAPSPQREAVDSAEELAAKIGGNVKVIAEEPYYRYIPKNGLKLSTKVSMTVSDQFKMVKMIHLKL